MKLYAWVGEDELNSGVVGLKQGLVPAGYIPLVAIEQDLHKLNTQDIRNQLQLQATIYGKTIWLAEFTLTADPVVSLFPGVKQETKQ